MAARVSPRAGQRERLVDALAAAAAAGHSQVEIYFGKGLAGGRPEAIDATRDTATNPAALDAFALAICGAGAPPAYPGVPGHEPDPEKARRDAAAVTAAMGELRKLTPRPASYVWETDYFEPNWRGLVLGRQLLAAARDQQKYDPEGLFFSITASAARTGARTDLCEGAESGSPVLDMQFGAISTPSCGSCRASA